MIRTSDGGILLAGYSSSIASGTKTCDGFGGSDGWLVKLDAQGEKQWDMCLGGTENEAITSVQETKDGGFIVLGYSFSPPSGNKTAPIQKPGVLDLWLIRLDSKHAIVWDISLGSVVYSVKVLETQDGGFLATADSLHNDFRAIRLDSMGKKLWDATYGGDDTEFLSGVVEVAGGGFLLAGTSFSLPSGTKTARYWGDPEDVSRTGDYWIVRIDGQGSKLWDKSYGGNSQDLCLDIINTRDGNYLLGGWSVSELGSRTAPTYGGDYWIVKIDQDGNQLWDSAYGNQGAQAGFSVMTLLPDGGFALAGKIGLSDPRLPGTQESQPFGGGDAWVVRTDASGRKLWDLTWGGSSGEKVAGILPERDGGLLIAGLSSSPISGSRTIPKYGSADGWVLKLAPENLSTNVQVCIGSTTPLSIPQDGFRVRMSGPTNLIYSLESSVDLITWTGMIPDEHMGATQKGTHLVEIRDWGATNAGVRKFYRARVSE